MHRRWAEWGERNPPASRRARAALSRRSVRASCAALFALSRTLTITPTITPTPTLTPTLTRCAALFAPLSHGLARRTAWSELLHGGRLGLCDPRGGGGGCGGGGGGGGGGLLEQICAISPTALAAAPRFFTLLQRRYALEYEQRLQTGLQVGLQAELQPSLGKLRELFGSAIEFRATLVRAQPKR